MKQFAICWQRNSGFWTLISKIRHNCESMNKARNQCLKIDFQWKLWQDLWIHGVETHVVKWRSWKVNYVIFFFSLFKWNPLLMMMVSISKVQQVGGFSPFEVRKCSESKSKKGRKKHTLGGSFVATYFEAINLYLSILHAWRFDWKTLPIFQFPSRQGNES